MKMLTTVATLLALILIGTSAHAQRAVNFRVELSGDQEVPPVETDTRGTTILHIDQSLTEIRFKLDIVNAEGILGAAGAHLHCAPAGENGPVVAFLAGAATPGFDGEVEIRATLTDDSIVNDACGEDIAELVESMASGNVYINVHSVDNPGGEVRGQI